MPNVTLYPQLIIDALKGVRFDREAVRSALAPLPIREIFGSIGPDEILQLLFDL